MLKQLTNENFDKETENGLKVVEFYAKIIYVKDAFV